MEATAARVVKRFLRAVTNTYFQRIQVRGRKNLPADPLAEKAAREQEKAEADRARAARGQDVTAIVQAVPVTGNQATSNGRFYRQEEEPQEFYDGDEGPFTGSVQSDRAAQPVRPLCAARAYAVADLSVASRAMRKSTTTTRVPPTTRTDTAAAASTRSREAEGREICFVPINVPLQHKHN